jgi:hypothetical protein
MPPKNIRRPTAESRAAVSIIRSAKPSWQRRQTRLTSGREIGNSITASAQASTVKLLSKAEAAAPDGVPGCYRIGRPICSHKIELNFLNGNLTVPAVARYINGLARMDCLNIVEGDEPWVLQTGHSLRVCALANAFNPRADRQFPRYNPGRAKS